jgi:hypothetical protein
MKCPVVKRYLLRLSNPDRPCQSVRDHLSRCPTCRTAQEGLLQLENEVRLLPIPESENKLVFVRQFRGGKVGTVPGSESRWLPWQVRDRARRKLALAASLAAGILLFVTVWALVHRSGNVDVSSAENPVAVHRQKLQRELKSALADAHSTSERVAVYRSKLKSLDLIKVAKDSSEDELTETVGFYRDEFMNGLLQEAGDVPVDDRKVVLTSLAEQLDATAEAAKYSARYQNESKAMQLNLLAAAANKRADEVRAMI